MKRLHTFPVSCAGLCLLLPAVLALLFSSCRRERQEVTPPLEYASYIQAYTGGVVSHTSAIRIELAQPLPMVELNTEIPGSPFGFSPSLKGKACWIDNRTIEFTPGEGALQSGTLYNATFRLGDFVPTAKGHELFRFSFRVAERHFVMTLDAPDVTEDDPDGVTLKGELLLSDAVERSLVEKMLSARTNGKQQAALSVEPGDGDASYRFTFSGIRKSKEETTLTVEADGRPAGIRNTLREKIAIPPQGVFTFLSASRISRPENGIQAVFSEPLSASQDLDGLIRLSGVPSCVLQAEGNKVNIYFTPGGEKEELKLDIHEGVRNANGDPLGRNQSVAFSRQAMKPAVEILSRGTIIPGAGQLSIPFRTTGLYAVDLSVIRIFESNVLMFLQDNASLGASRELRRSGRLVYRKTLWLDTKDPAEWKAHSIDLAGLIAQEPGAIYRVVFSFRQEYAAYPCAGGDKPQPPAVAANNMVSVSAGEMTEEDEAVWDTPDTYYSPYNGIDWDIYLWEEKDNPCHPSYYMSPDRLAACNVLASNLGLIVKRNHTDKVWVALTDILTTRPVAQADVTVYNFQLQPVGSARTDAEGFALISVTGKPFAVVASADKQKAYLRVADGEEQSTSRFDTGGKEIRKGLKGFIYGERGVWRPGDTLHIAFILEDREGRIPGNHPVTLELYNPRGQFYSKSVSTGGTNGFHTFRAPTAADDPTGLWNAYVKAGGVSFHKPLRIETIKPNRLKIDLALPGESLRAGRTGAHLSLASSWLTGAAASGLEARVEARLSKTNTRFAGYSQYQFNNPATEFTASREDVFQGRLDPQGKAAFTWKLPEAGDAPGLLRADITTRVFEPGGDASIHTLTVPFAPFEAYVGVNLNQPQGKYLETDQDHAFDIVTLDADGRPVNRRGLEYKVYRLDWSWWWENRDESFASYMNNTSVTPVASGRLATTDGKAQFTFRVNYPDWGRYLVYVKDPASGHASGGTVFIDWPDWRGRSARTDPSGVTMLTFSLDKESYETGEQATAIIPAAAAGRALVTLENGSTILRREWVDVSPSGDTRYRFEVTPEMTPNVYVHVTLLQPHAQAVNDLPIRLYGVIPAPVTRRESVLEPQISMPAVLRPETEFTVTVSEKKGRPMTYTLAVVDDGLLDLTNFRTPDPWSEFYAREALGIRTWDMFDDVIGAYAGAYSTLFSIGGDEALNNPGAQANRFRPVVKFLGPFTLNKGKSAAHRITLPMYTGSVRTMVVAGQDGAYGNAEQTTPVRTPLMILATLPRVLSAGEDILLPVNVFAMEESVKDVTVSLQTSANLQTAGAGTQQLTFRQTGDEMVYFRLRAGAASGKETVRITAVSGAHSAGETVEIEVRNPNPIVTHRESRLLEAGETAQLHYQAGGNPDDSWVKLEVSRIPQPDISRRFDFLYNYGHYCSEQLTSRALPLLFIDRFKDVDKKEAAAIRLNVQEAIRNLYARQLPNGGFAYWPGDAVADEWITSYAGNFLVMAREKGYEVNTLVTDKWKSYQRRAAQNWTPPADEAARNRQAGLQQAYRLYTLALAGAPEAGAMNRLKEMPALPLQARWRLAAAYALNGKTAAANELASGAQTLVEPYTPAPAVYGSFDRDEAMILETLVLMDKDREAFEQARKVSENLSKESAFNTQSTAFALMAMGQLAGKLSGSLQMGWTLNGKQQPDVKSAKAVWLADIPLSTPEGELSLRNNGKGLLYVSLVTRTKPVRDTLPAQSNNLRLEVEYTGAGGQPLDVAHLTQGADFTARVTVTNTNGFTDYTGLALTHIIPAGWEIFNERLAAGSGEAPDAQSYTWRDIRDDRVLTYFDLERHRSKTFEVRLQATYAGTFVRPAILCEAMYDTSAQARTEAGEVEVRRRGE
jgi:uncharacterized protein YfaS (alpha-2-macroglobulin family)